MRLRQNNNEHGAMIKIGTDLNHVAITKEIRNDFGNGEVRTNTALNSYTEDQVTLRTVEIIYTQHKLNLEILKQVYQM